mgnify:CR=1 FL=1
MPRLTLAALIALAFVSLVLAESKNPPEPPVPPSTPPPAAESETPKFHLSKPIVKDIAELEHFVYGEVETTFETMMDAMTKTFFPLMESLGKDGVVYDYPAIFIYNGVKSDDPKAKFTLVTGYPARPECKAPKGYKIGKLEGHHGLSADFTGPLSEISHAYQAIFKDLLAAGHQPTGQTRELYLYWDGEESPNTVVEIQVTIAKPGKDHDAKKD